MSLFEYAKNHISDDPTTKKLQFYKKYDEFFGKNNINPATILELGVFRGESTKVFSNVFPDAKIIAGDLELRDIDFSDCPNVKYIKIDQRDKNSLEAVVSNEFPDGIDFILDDASHIGYFSIITFNILFPLLKKGGIYAIEDWGTGYWDTWVDGSRFQAYPLNSLDGNIPKRIPSHDFGMVGFVKSLVDLIAEESYKAGQGEMPKRETRIRSLEIVGGICFATKA